jgi:hypothetical protein
MGNEAGALSLRLLPRLHHGDPLLWLLPLLLLLLVLLIVLLLPLMPQQVPEDLHLQFLYLLLVQQGVLLHLLS